MNHRRDRLQPCLSEEIDHGTANAGRIDHLTRAQASVLIARWQQEATARTA